MAENEKDSSTTGAESAKETVIAPGGPRSKSTVYSVAPGEHVHADAEGHAAVVPALAKGGVPEMVSDRVLTPGGYRHPSRVHRVEHGHAIVHEPDRARPRLVNLATHQTQELAPVEPAAAVVPALGSGWITYAFWNNGTGHTLTSFATTWVVPDPPSTNHNQTIFLFNGIQNYGANFGILQPVLQWGPSAAGGGAFWSIASWYVTTGGDAFHTNLITVNPGDTLIGVMTKTGQSGSLFNYASAFQGIANTTLNVTNIAELLWLNETLESYGVQTCSDYPNSNPTALRAIAVQTAGATPALNWTPVNSVTDCGQHTVVVSNSATNGEVDLFYRQQGWRSLGGTITSGISADTWAANRLDVVVRGTNGNVFHKWWNGGDWGPSLTGWENMGGPTTDTPNIVSWGPNRLDIFARGTDGSVCHKWWSGAWGPSLTTFEGLGGQIQGAPVAVSWGANRLDVFVRGMDNAVWHKWWNGSAWGPSVTGWESLGGVITSAPTAVSWGPNRLDLFARGSDGAMWHKWWNGSAWGGWESLGGVIVGAPAPVAWGPNRLDIFARGTDNACWHRWWNGSAWGGWESLGGVITDIPSAVSWAANRLDVFVRGSDSAVYHKWWNGSAWGPSLSGGWERLGSQILGPICPVSWAANRLDLFVRGTDNAVWHDAWDGSNWAG